MKMGSSFKKAIFDQHIQEGLVGWARQAKKNKGLRKAANGNSAGSPPGAAAVQMTKVREEDALLRSQAKGTEIVTDQRSNSSS